MVTGCPYADRNPSFRHILCKRRYNGRKPETEKECIHAVCGHQYFCPNTQRWELTPEAEKCPTRKTEKDGEQHG